MIVKKVEHKCLECNNSFFEFKSQNRKYCDKDCYSKNQRKRTGELSNVWGKKLPHSDNWKAQMKKSAKSLRKP